MKNLSDNAIFKLKNTLAIQLIEAAEAFKADIDSSPFDIEDAKLLFNDLVEVMNEISELLLWEDEEQPGMIKKEFLKMQGFNLTNYP